MLTLVCSNSPFFDKETASADFDKNAADLDDVNGFDYLVRNSLFWNVYEDGEYIGGIFVYEADDDERKYLGGYCKRKRHKAVVEAIKRVSDYIGDIWAETRHINAVISLKEAGFKWVSREKRLLFRKGKE